MGIAIDGKLTHSVYRFRLDRVSTTRTYEDGIERHRNGPIHNSMISVRA